MTVDPTTPAPVPGARRSISRRGLLAGAAAGGVAALVPLSGEAVARQFTAAVEGKAKPASAIDFFGDSSLNYSALSPVGAAAYGASNLGEVLTTFNRIHQRDNTYGAYGEEFLAIGRKLAREAEAAEHAGRKVTARDCYLRAATYLDQALFYVFAGDHPTRARQAVVYREMERAFARAGALFAPKFERVAIPYGKRQLPGWLMTPPGKRIRRPTIILNNGSDAQNIDMYVFGGRAAVDRGFNALIFEGPGQGSNLFLHGIPFRSDWEHVIIPVVDFLRAHPAVDRKRIVLSGSSFGGYLVARAAAFEHRLAALIVDPGVVNTFISWQQQLPKPLLKLLYAHERDTFNTYWHDALAHLPAAIRFEVRKRAQIFGFRSFYDQMTLARQFVLTKAVAGRIATPTIVTEPQQDAFYPGQSLKLTPWLTARPKRLERFTASDGSQFHCEPMNPTVRNDRIFDWVEGHLRPTS